MSLNNNDENLKRDSPFIIILDGDNTLWDTNSVFVNAQNKMLRCLKKTVNKIDDFRKLRQIDDMLVNLYAKHEYDFSVLALALNKFFKGSNEEEAVQKAYMEFESGSKNKEIELAIKCGNALRKELLTFPKLFKHSKQTLRTLKKRGHILILSSEGDERRIKRIIEHHSMSKLFHHIMTRAKSIKQFNEAKRIGMQLFKKRCLGGTPRTVVVGDLLDRDIFFGNQIKAITILKPGSYKENQKPQNKHQIPDYTINDIKEIVQILDKESAKNKD